MSCYTKKFAVKVAFLAFLAFASMGFGLESKAMARTGATGWNWFVSIWECLTDSLNPYCE
jgi:hypothetical protein